MQKSYAIAAGLLLALPATACSAQTVQPAALATAPAAPAVDKLVLLGTGGGPIARVSRSQPANMLRVGDKTYLIDIGDGTPRQIVRAGTRLSTVDAVFITHLHFDHTAGIMGFIALDWQDRRKKPVGFYGPPGTSNLVADTLKALASAEGIFRPQLPDLQPMASIFSGQDWDVTAAREVYRDEAVTVRAVENSHYGTMRLPQTDHGTNRAYSYRFETPGRSIVFTGDTGPSAALEQLAKGADILVSEVIDLPALMDSMRRRAAATGTDLQALIDHMADEHLTPENVGKLAAAAGVKKLILSHFATPPGNETANKDYILTGIRKHYVGPVDFGEDLAEF